jgi:hypothetical protein
VGRQRRPPSAAGPLRQHPARDGAGPRRPLLRPEHRNHRRRSVPQGARRADRRAGPGDDRHPRDRARRGRGRLAAGDRIVSAGTQVGPGAVANVAPPTAPAASGGGAGQ